MGCLPDVVVVGYCPSDGYSGLSSEAEPTTKDRPKHNQHMTICNNMMNAMTWQNECVLAQCKLKQKGMNSFESKIQMLVHLT